MNRNPHWIIALIVFCIINLFSSQITTTLIMIPTAMSLFPDVDAGTRYHRYWLCHSIIPWVIVWLFNPMLLTALICLGVGIHCLLDIHLNRAKMTGFYTIKLFRVLKLHLGSWEYKMIGLNGIKSTLWLFINFLIAILILLIQIKVIM